MSPKNRGSAARAESVQHNQERMNKVWSVDSGAFLTAKKKRKKQKGHGLTNTSVPALKQNNQPLHIAQEIQTESHLPPPPSQREQPISSRAAQNSSKSRNATPGASKFVNQLFSDAHGNQGIAPSCSGRLNRSKSNQMMDSPDNSRKNNTRNQRRGEKIAGTPRNSGGKIVDLCGSDEDTSCSDEVDHKNMGKTSQQTTTKKESKEQNATRQRASAENKEENRDRSRSAKMSYKTPDVADIFESNGEYDGSGCSRHSGDTSQSSLSTSNRKRRSPTNESCADTVLVDTDEEEVSETTGKESPRRTTRSPYFQSSEDSKRRGRSTANRSEETPTPSSTKRRKRIQASKEEDSYSEALSSRTSTPQASDRDTRAAFDSVAGTNTAYALGVEDLVDRDSPATRSGYAHDRAILDELENGRSSGLHFTKVNNIKKKEQIYDLDSPDESPTKYAMVGKGSDDESDEDYTDDESSKKARKSNSGKTRGVNPKDFHAKKRQQKYGSISLAGPRRLRDRSAKNGSATEYGPKATGRVKIFDEQVSRIAIGKKVHKTGCKLTIFDNGMMRLNPNASGGFVHDILYAEIGEPQYFRSISEPSFDGYAGPRSFISMYVEPNDANHLTKYLNAYNKTKGVECHYIVVEFQSDKDLNEVMGAVSLAKESCGYDKSLWETSKLKPLDLDDIPIYAKALINDSNKNGTGKQQQATRSTRRSRRRGASSESAMRKRKFLGDRCGDDVLLVYPFAADPELIDGAASDLTEAKVPLHIPQRTSSSAANVAGAGGPKLADRNTTKCEQTSLVTKAKQRAHYLTIRADDYERLDSGEFLNDTLIDFWMQWMWRKEDKSTSDLHFFTSHFFTTLSEEGPAAVENWTAKKNIDVFTKKLVFIPINRSLHWSLCILVNPGAVLNNSCTESDNLYSCMLFLDSLKAHSITFVKKNILKWLNSEWKRLGKGEPDGDDPFVGNKFAAHQPTVPYQDNSWDCGVFVCRYAFAMLRLRQKEFTLERVFDGKKNNAFRTLIRNSDAFRFNMDDIARLREELRTLVENLSHIYDLWKEAQDEEDSIASPGKAEVVMSPKKKKKSAGKLVGETPKPASNPALFEGAQSTEENNGQTEQAGEPELSNSNSDVDNGVVPDKNRRGETSLNSADLLVEPSAENSSEERDDVEVPDLPSDTAAVAPVSKDKDGNSCDQPQQYGQETTENKNELPDEDGVPQKRPSLSTTSECTRVEKENTVNEAIGADGICHQRPTVDTTHREPTDNSEHPRVQSVPESPPNRKATQHQLAEVLEI